MLWEISGEITPEKMKGWSQSKTMPSYGCDWWCQVKPDAVRNIGTWNVRSMNQGKLEVVKQEKARVKIDILGISELKWTGMGEFNSDDHYIYYCWQESLGRNGVAVIVSKRVWPQDQRRSVFIPMPKKGNAKECSNYHTIALISHISKVMLKILQARL